jgi:hypothetical protein
VAAHPPLGGGVPLGVEGPGGLPQVFEHMDEVHENRDRGGARVRLGLDPVDLVVVAVDERDPGPSVGGVAPAGLVEELADDRRGVLDHTRGQPLALRLRSRRRGLTLGVCLGQDVARRARGGRCVVDGADLRDPFAVALLALG